MTNKPFVIATDLSARSDRALARAAMIATEHGVRLFVVHAVDDELPANVAEYQREQAQSLIANALASLPGEAAATARVEVGFGEPYSVILNASEAHDADLVAIGKHRSDVLLDLFRGSTAERVIRFGTRPVLLVKQRPARPYASVLVATDFSPPSRRALEFAAALVPNGHFRLLHAYDVPFRGILFGGSSIDRLAKRHEQQFEQMVTQQMSEHMASLPPGTPRIEPVLKYGAPETMILQAAKESPPDLLVVGTHGRTGVGRALLGSVAETVIDRAESDVLAVRGW